MVLLRNTQTYFGNCIKFYLVPCSQKAQMNKKHFNQPYRNAALIYKSPYGICFSKSDIRESREILFYAFNGTHKMFLIQARLNVMLLAEILCSFLQRMTVNER